MEGSPRVKEKVEKEARDILKKVEEKAKEKHISCETILHVGHQPHEFIIKEAKEKNIDLIVMGTHGRTGLKKFVMGSVAQKVIGYTPCPVMVVPGPGSENRA
jgi:nucleotide-binding universal stress UspA family protein